MSGICGESCWGGAGLAMPGGQHRGSGDVLEATSPWMAGSGPAVHGTDCHLELCLSKPKSERPQVTRRSWLLLWFLASVCLLSWRSDDTCRALVSPCQPGMSCALSWPLLPADVLTYISNPQLSQSPLLDLPPAT